VKGFPFDHQTSIVVFWGIILAVGITNIWFIPKLGFRTEPSRWPKVSILVPARNESENIELCVQSLLAQDYPNFEVLVLDDHSTDDTWQKLEKLAKQNPLLRILRGLPLPERFLGKHWACHQLAQAAEGELLLFTDADTRHAPHALRSAVGLLLAENASFLTAFPHQEVVSWGERLDRTDAFIQPVRLLPHRFGTPASNTVAFYKHRTVYAFPPLCLRSHRRP
jgi:chlorobactene glucosyltransferase